MAVELLDINVWTGMVIGLLPNVVTAVVVVLDFVMETSYFVEYLSDVIVEALIVDVGVEVLTDVTANALGAVITAWNVPMPMP